jgi:hypothetical protein
MPKTSVYLSDELAEAVRKAGISLSPVCQEALEKEVQRVQAQKEATSDLEEVATRLKETASEEAEEQHEMGLDVGREWARDVATISELRRVAGVKSMNWYSAIFPVSLNNSISQRDDVFELFPEWDPNYIADMDERSWEREPFTEGLIEGAAEILEAVEPLL